MARPKKYLIQLSDNEVITLKSILRNRDTNITSANRCHILLDIYENHLPAKSYGQCIESYCVSRATIATVAKEYVEGGIPSVMKRERSINSDNEPRKVDGCVEARLIEVACGPAPKGHSRWTIRLLENEMKIILDEPISREAIRRTLQNRPAVTIDVSPR